MNSTAAGLDWRREGADWPQRECSSWSHAGGVRWHVQQAGSGPTVLLLHGTGSATHSWRDLMPALSAHFHVLAVDLPGHGFSTRLPGSTVTLPAMANALAALLRQMRIQPAIIVGHSAGAAIGARLCLDGAVQPKLLVGINAALLPWRGWPSVLFAPAARFLAGSEWSARLFASRARDPAAFGRLMATTGSSIDARGLQLYQRLVTHTGHVGGVLQMLAGWDLHPLQRDLPRLAVPLLLIAGENDRTLPPSEAERVRAMVPGARLIRLAGAGHLAHEEQPQQVARLITEAAPGSAADQPVDCSA